MILLRDLVAAGGYGPQLDHRLAVQGRDHFQSITIYSVTEKLREISIPPNQRAADLLSNGIYDRVLAF